MLPVDVFEPVYGNNDNSNIDDYYNNDNKTICWIYVSHLRFMNIN